MGGQGRTFAGASPSYAPAVETRTTALSALIDEILASPADVCELRDLIAACGRGNVQGCIQIGQREAEARQLAREQADSDLELATPKELSQRYGETEYAIRQHVRQGRLEMEFPSPGATRNGKIRVGKYRRMRGN